jgi:4-hydroxymandelate oxidase
MPGRGFLADLEERAAAVLDEPVLRYFRQGARDSVSTDEAPAAWAARRLLPRVLRDVSVVDPSVTLLGHRVPGPLGIAPTTLQRAAHPDGEVATARAAAAAGAPMVLSSNAGATFAEVAETGVHWWLQIYLGPDRTAAVPLLRRAREAGARAVVLTVDTPVVGTKYDPGPAVWEVADPGWLRVNHGGDPEPGPGGDKATDLGPHDIDWLRKETGLPVVVKGVLRADEARRCVDAGAAAVWVSNHGGRQLDRVAATADCLAAVADEVGDHAEVYVDGGIRSGLDVATALACGARGVFLGRPVLYALAVAGEAGVAELLRDLSEELVETMRLLGCSRIESVRADLLAPGSHRSTVR